VVSNVSVGRPDLYEVFLGLYDVPAYVRRARAVEQACEDLLERCRRRRAELLREVCDRVARLRPEIAGTGILAELEAALPPLAEGPAEPLRPRQLRREVSELAAAVERFNGAWAGFLGRLDLLPVNALREGYNRYYLLEKECALRSPSLARRGYQPLDPLTLDEVAALFPPLPVPNPH
jgi:hypothetical protein